MSNPKQLGRIGIFYIEEAILEVLSEAMETSPEAPFVRAVDVARKIGVYKDWDQDRWLVPIILKKLEADGRVEQREARGPWKLTEVEYQKHC